MAMLALGEHALAQPHQPRQHVLLDREHERLEEHLPGEGEYHRMQPLLLPTCMRETMRETCNAGREMREMREMRGGRMCTSRGTDAAGKMRPDLGRDLVRDLASSMWRDLARNPTCRFSMYMRDRAPPQSSL